MKYRTGKIESILWNDYQDEGIRYIVNHINAYDGTFIDTPIDYRDMDELPEILGCPACMTCLEILWDASSNGSFDIRDKYFIWGFDDDLYSVNELNYDYYLDEIAEWLVDHYDTPDLPDEVQKDTILMNAIRSVFIENQEYPD